MLSISSVYASVHSSACMNYPCTCVCMCARRVRGLPHYCIFMADSELFSSLSLCHNLKGLYEKEVKIVLLFFSFFSLF